MWLLWSPIEPEPRGARSGPLLQLSFLTIRVLRKWVGPHSASTTSR